MFSFLQNDNLQIIKLSICYLRKCNESILHGYLIHTTNGQTWKNKFDISESMLYSAMEQRCLPYLLGD